MKEAIGWLGILLVGVVVIFAIEVMQQACNQNLPLINTFYMHYRDRDVYVWLPENNAEQYFPIPQSLETLNHEASEISEHYSVRCDIILRKVIGGRYYPDLSLEQEKNAHILLIVNPTQKESKIEVPAVYRSILSQNEADYITSLMNIYFEQNDYYHGILTGLQMIEQCCQSYETFDRQWKVASDL